jgi:3-hydroxyisobutyrate dehydrogenase
MIDRIGVVGLGEMGLPMARNLRKAGFEVLGFDSSDDARRRARADGVTLLDSAAEVAANVSRAVFSVVRDLAQTEAVLFGPDGVGASGRPGTGIIVTSTLSPRSVRAVGARAAALGFPILDSPVSGARTGAEAGTLTVMTSGPGSLHEACLPYFRAIGENVFYLGEELGAGQAAKLTNNLILGAAMVACAEGLRFARCNGIPEERALEVLEVSTARCWVVQNWGVVRRFWTEYSRGGTLDIVAKDLRAVVEESLAAASPTPLTATCLQQLLDAWERPAP